MKILVIENEQLLLQELTNVLLSYAPEVEIAGALRTTKEVESFLKSGVGFDLIFTDIELIGGTCFDFLPLVDSRIPIVFTTGFESRAIDAFEYNAIGYLVKPLEVEAVHKVLEKFAKNQLKWPVNLEKLAEMWSEKTRNVKRLITKIGDQYNFINVDEVLYFESLSGISYAITASNKFLLDRSLNQLEQEIDNGQFFRVNRKTLLSRAYIRSFKILKEGGLQISCHASDIQFKVSRLKSTEFRNWIMHDF